MAPTKFFVFFKKLHYICDVSSLCCEQMKYLLTELCKVTFHTYFPSRHCENYFRPLICSGKLCLTHIQLWPSQPALVGSVSGHLWGGMCLTCWN